MSPGTHLLLVEVLRGKKAEKTFYFIFQLLRFDNLRDRLKQKEDYQYTYDNSTTEECNDLIEDFEKSPAIRFLWTNIKPLVRGKILFTPDTPATR